MPKNVVNNRCTGLEVNSSSLEGERKYVSFRYQQYLKSIQTIQTKLTQRLDQSHDGGKQRFSVSVLREFSETKFWPRQKLFPRQFKTIKNVTRQQSYRVQELEDLEALKKHGKRSFWLLSSLKVKSMCTTGKCFLNWF